jgi:hypothetical protein
MSMRTLKAHVRNGRLIMNEPTDIQEGSEIELAIADDEDNLDEQERERLHRALRKSWASAKRGDTRPVREIMRAAAGNVQEIRDPEQGETGRTRPRLVRPRRGNLHRAQLAGPFLDLFRRSSS